MRARPVDISKRAITLLILSAFILGQARLGAGAIDPGSVRAAALAAGLNSLATVPVPPVSNLTDFLKPGAQTTAIRLGKAFFWDMQAGSDGQACGSCHFHAGADNRARNQLSPGLRSVTPDTRFGNNFFGVPGFPQFGPDFRLNKANFPFHTLQIPDEKNFLAKKVLRDTNDVTSSMGVFAANFTGVVKGQSADQGVPFVDPTFNVQTPSASSIDKNVRRVEPRNTPTMINAVLTHANFWDGRAHNLFNGVSVIGPLDQDARIWVNSGGLNQQTVRIPNSSLASQAVGPPTSNLEMSFFDRPFPMVGRKLLSLTPLGLQLVDPTDGVLGPLSRFPKKGLNNTYSALIQAAFQDKYWNGGSVTLPSGTFTQMEANFTLFWGLAIQLYETALVSNRAPFDLFMEGSNTALSQQQLQGLLVFINRGKNPDGTTRNPAEVDAAIAGAGVSIGTGNCVSCHAGPEFTEAAFTNLTSPTGLELIELEDTPVLTNGLLAVSTTKGLLDNGFANIGVRPVNDDLGRGGKENNFPLSFTRQALDPNLNFLLPPGTDLPCTPGPSGNCPAKVQVDGAFKIPDLRQAELTGPFFHNGGQAELTQVIDFYDRQGDFGDINIANLDQNLAFVNLSEVDGAPLLAFLPSLTDERVRQEQAPFDHPEIDVPNGGTFGKDERRIEVPAVGAGGRPASGLMPLQPFLTVSKMRGTGTLGSGGASAGFGVDFDLREAGPSQGKLYVDDQGQRIKIRSNSVTTFSANETCVTVWGPAQVNGYAGYTFGVMACDHRQAGDGRDSFAITVFDSFGTVVYDRGGVLSGGNVQAYIQ
jgi:cytochrome c peroxidase